MNSYLNKKVLITGGLGFIGSNLARALVAQGAEVTLVDSLIPQYGGNSFNIEGIRDKVTVNVCDVRDPFAMAYLLKDKDFLFNLAGQSSHMDSMSDPQTDINSNFFIFFPSLGGYKDICPCHQNGSVRFGV